MPTMMEKKLVDMLVKEGVITQIDLDNALGEQDKSGLSLGRILIDRGFTTEWEMAEALCKRLNVPFITLSHYDIDEGVLQTIPADLARKYKIIPVDKAGDQLTIALADPSNIYIMDEIRLLTKSQITPVISFESDIVEALARYYPETGGENGSGGRFDEMLKEISEGDVRSVRDELEAESLNFVEGSDDEPAADEAEVNDAPVIQLVNMIVSEAIKAGASDIHIEPYEKTLRLRYRVDGVLQEMTPPPKKFQNAIVSRIKIMSDIDIAERRLPSDGRFRLKYNDRPIDFRVSTCPVIHGEKVVMRILDQGKLMLNMSDLGFDADELAKFEIAIKKPWGMVLITGPTGSGKSTTLYSALSTINDPKKNINTAEDPVEYNLRGINQVNVKPDIGLNFARALKAFLRQDPDIIMVGEIRDLETAEISIKAALTGHLVFSTVHTNDAPSTVQRMNNMGIEKFLITAALNLVEAQRLVRRICKNCRTEFKPSPEALKDMGVKEPNTVLYKGAGCEVCRHSGFKGRCGIYEIMAVTDAIRNAIMEGEPTHKLKALAMKEGMSTLRGAGIRKVLQGISTFDEIAGSTLADDE